MCVIVVPVIAVIITHCVTISIILIPCRYCSNNTSIVIVSNC